MLSLLVASSMLFVLGFNNGAAIKSSLVSSGIQNQKKASLLVASGLISGSILEGWKMERIQLVSTSVNLYTFQIVLVTLLIMFILSLFNSPASLAQIFFSSALGILIVKHASINFNLSLEVVLSWLFTPFFSVLLAYLMYKLTFSFIQKFCLLKVTLFSKLVALVAVFYSSYVLGANNIGLISAFYGGSPIVGLLFSIVASLGVYFSKKLTKALGEDLIVVSPVGASVSTFSASFLVWIFTQLGLPVSVTTSIMSSVIGVGLASKIRVFNLRTLFSVTVVGWGLSALLGLLFGNLAGIYLA
ncbi:MAG: inorganic phosphate transporter [Thermoproteota archaeon]